MGYAFISYSTKNQDYARQLIRKLENNGITVWIDNLSVRHGENWWQAIVNGLSAASAVIVLMTPDSQKSDWVQREILLAEQLKKPIFPVLVEGKNWDIFIHIQIADGMEEQGLPSNDFFKELCSLLNIETHTLDSATVTQNARDTQLIMPPDRIRNVRGCLDNATVIAAIITSVATIIVGLISVVLPMLLSPLDENPSLQMTNIAQTSTLNTSLTPQITSMPTEMFTPTTSQSSSSQPTATQQMIDINVVRGRDSIAISVNVAADLSNLVLDFGGNERYRLGDIFPESSSTTANEVWCLRQRANSQPIDNCLSQNSYITPNTINIWRNASIGFYVDGSQIGTCVAEPAALQPYRCEMMNVNLP